VRLVSKFKDTGSNANIKSNKTPGLKRAQISIFLCFAVVSDSRENHMHDIAFHIKTSTNSETICIMNNVFLIK